MAKPPPKSDNDRYEGLKFETPKYTKDYAPESQDKIDNLTPTNWGTVKKLFTEIDADVWEQGAQPRLKNALIVCALELDARKQALTDSEVFDHLTSLNFHLKEVQELHSKVWWALPGDRLVNDISSDERSDFETLTGRMVKASEMAIDGWKSNRRPKDHAKRRFIETTARIYFDYKKSNPTQQNLHAICKTLLRFIDQEVSLDMCAIVIKKVRDQRNDH
jgi:hypothetical protein